MADRQQHMRSVLAGVVDDEVSPPKTTDMDAGVVSTDSDDPTLTPPFVTPMTFIDDVQPTYPEPNESGPSTLTSERGSNEL
jgi:hypothetical protein